MSYSLKEKQNTFLNYVRQQVLSVVQNINRTIRIEHKNRIYAMHNMGFHT
jgi:hypothetical protein